MALTDQIPGGDGLFTVQVDVRGKGNATDLHPTEPAWRDGPGVYTGGSLLH